MQQISNFLSLPKQITAQIFFSVLIEDVQPVSKFYLILLPYCIIFI